MNSQHETSTASNEQQHQINIETSNNIEIISSDTKDLLIDTTNNSVLLNCVELTQECLQKEVKLQAQLTKYYEDLHLQNEFIKVLNVNIQIALCRSRALQLRETDLK